MSALAKLALAPLFALALAEPGPAPVAMPVPGALLELTSMPEPSGVVWSKELSRYLVISDDTGRKERGTNHLPILFAVSSAGVFDAAPVPIVGIEKLNDAEAICHGPDGTYLLATSHSQNRKGRDKAERRLLLQLALRGRMLYVVRSLDLYDAIAAARVLPEGGVDIEALALHQGSLYVGLKAPQSAQGHAIILRIAELAAWLKPGAPAPRSIERWAELPLRVPAASGEATQGISDMSFLPDGSLAVLANSPKHLPADGGGALWLLKKPQAPRLVRRFLGLKPEGVTLTEDGRALLIVIDHDRQQPLWLRQPLP